MSDGNFNRALLPKNELAAGLRAGRAQMRARAEVALRQLLTERFPLLNEAEHEELITRFLTLLRENDTASTPK